MHCMDVGLIEKVCCVVVCKGRKGGMINTLNLHTLYIYIFIDMYFLKIFIGSFHFILSSS